MSIRRTVKSQERRVAQDMSGNRQPGSGSAWHSKADVTTRRFLVECKQTGAISYSLKLAVLDKVAGEAAKVGKDPVLQVDFMRPAGIESYVVIPYHLFLSEFSK